MSKPITKDILVRQLKADGAELLINKSKKAGMVECTGGSRASIWSFEDLLRQEGLIKRNSPCQRFFAQDYGSFRLENEEQVSFAKKLFELAKMPIHEGLRPIPGAEPYNLKKPVVPGTKRRGFMVEM